MTDITQNITAPDRYLLRTTRRIGMMSYKSARVRFDHRTTVQGINMPSSFVLDADNLTKEFFQFFTSDGNQSMKLAFRTRSNFVDEELVDVTPEVWLEIEYELAGAGSRWWNQANGTWESSSYVNKFEMIDGGLLGEGLIQYNLSVDFETAKFPDLIGEGLRITFHNARTPSDYEFFPVQAVESTFFQTYFEILNVAVEEGQNTAIDYMLTQQSPARGRYDDGAIWFGDGPTLYARSAITRDAEGEELTSAWRFADEATPIIHANILLREVMDMKRTQVRGLTADLLGEYKPCKMINVDSFFHFFIGGNQNGKDNKWAANLFRLNRVTDFALEPSNGRYVTTNYSTGFNSNVIFQYRDPQGNIIHERTNTEASANHLGMIWIAENSWIYADSNGVIRRIDYDPNAGTSSVTLLREVSPLAGSFYIDIDEEGNIYHCVSGSNSLKKTSFTGTEVIETDLPGGWRVRVFGVDDAYVYAHSSGTDLPIYKLDRETFGVVENTASLGRVSTQDKILVFPEHIIHCHSAVATASAAIRKIRKSDMVVVEEIDDTEYNWRGIACDENYNIYAVTSTQLIKFDFDLNIIWDKSLGTSGAIQVEYSPAPINRILVRRIEDIRVYDTNGDPVATYTGHGSNRNLALMNNAHPGRVAVKFYYLGLTKQF